MPELLHAAALLRPRDVTSIIVACPSALRTLRLVFAQAQEHDMKSGGQKGLWKKGGKKPFSRRN